MAGIEVRVARQGNVAGDSLTPDPATEARCDGCGAAADAVARASGPEGAVSLCSACLRGCLEAITIARYRFRAGVSIPWGKVTG